MFFYIAIRKYKQSGLLESVAIDFNSSKSYLNGEIMLGSVYAFRKNTRRFIPYKDITNLYLIKSGPETILKYKLSNKRCRRMLYVYRYYHHKELKDEFLMMIKAIMDKNIFIIPDGKTYEIIHFYQRKYYFLLYDGLHESH